MPKIKTHSAAKKRFKITGSGKIVQRKSGGGHLMEKKTAKRKRVYRSSQTVSPGHAKNIKKLLGK